MSNRNLEYPIRGEIYSVERLEEFAAYLANQLEVSVNPQIRKPLLSRMHENRRELFTCYRALIEAIHKKEVISPAGEWLTDNFHVVEDQLRQVQEDLPPAFYKQLPKIALGELAGYPRIYSIALALIAHTDSHLDLDSMRRFVQAYQKTCPLQIGELWALAITIRLALIENLRRIAVRILNDHEKRNLANTFVNGLFEAVGDPKKLERMLLKLPSLCRHSVQDESAFMAQVSKRLRDQEPELWPALETLEKILINKKSSSEQVVHFLHQSQAANQVTVANIITSMRLISDVNWQDFFESVSLVDQVFESDSSYHQMDFLTRDRYRHVIEKISRETDHSEITIAETVLKFANQSDALSHEDVKRSHVGYYLIDKGLREIEKHFQCKTHSRKFFFVYPNLTYFGVIGFFLSLICSVPIYYSLIHVHSVFSVVYIMLLILIPCSDLALNLTNLVLTHAIVPQNLPKMDLSLGIPEKSRTMVVIPCMLSSTAVIHALLERIEVHYVGNYDSQLFFALLTDFTDNSHESSAQDGALLQKAIDGIARLNQKYPNKDQNRFYIFHRRRQWNGSENTWMGWERKRGKIHEFNRLLRGDQNTSFSIIQATTSFLSTMKYVLTLDADTQLPRDCARKLVGTMAHPLNQPYFDKTLGRVTEGYGVIQPRIGISLESSARSWFSKIMSEYTGIDPYTTAVSEVYQDLFREGSYTGKGIYDVDAFESALSGRVPENTLLSHDLFEGLYARAGLLTDVELLDDYPRRYYTFFTRQHRWTRGDWQIAGWIFAFVKNEKNKWVSNHLPLISRWKIFDNLRRSLVPFFTFLWFTMSWLTLPGSYKFWIGYILFIIFFPPIARTILEQVISYIQSISHKNSVARMKLKISIVQPVLYIIFLAHQAFIQMDAVVRVFYRKLVSKRKLLEWVTAAQDENRDVKKKRPLWQTSLPVQCILILEAILIYVLSPSQFNTALGFIAVWMCYPLAAKITGRSLKRNQRNLDLPEQLLMRQVARRTWHYFESFVNLENNWLPPDNHQVSPVAFTANRTSPTNMGLYILSLISARDFGYVNSSIFLSSLELTLSTMQKLEQREGHYLNWYDTRTLEALAPKYISTVDSGNLAGYLLVGRQACLEFKNWLIIDPRMIEGLQDTIAVIEAEMKESDLDSISSFENLKQCQKILSTSIPTHYSEWITFFKILAQAIEQLKNNVITRHENKSTEVTKIVIWIDSCSFYIENTLQEISLVAPWTRGEFHDLTLKLSKNKVLKSMDNNRSLLFLPFFYKNAINEMSRLVTSEEFSSSSLEILQLIDEIKLAKIKVKKMLEQATSFAEMINRLFTTMNFNFLMDQDRKVFSIGYSLSDQRFDSGQYDLLGSESRLASFVAIAKDDVPQEHWFRLGRLLVPTAYGPALVSWTASMFEYLMPTLVLHDYENTLLYQTANTIVIKQISYGHERHVPWGISEAGYNARDLQLNYQYGPFGVPGLGLKRGLSHDLVISPYSTFLAAMIYPKAAVENVKHLIRNGLLTEYGFYESVDYTPERIPPNQKFAVIRSFMAHHQGMTLTAINNVVHDKIIQNRFHNDPRVRATRLLLQERIPQKMPLHPPEAAKIELEEKTEINASSFVRHYGNPNDSSPHVQLLSNRNYSVMISTAGGNYSKCDNLAVNRWKEDATLDNWGSFIFVRELDQVWSTTYQPFSKLPELYSVTFREDKVEFSRRDGDVSTFTQLLVAPEDNVEIRYITLTNHSDEPKELELTSYLEPVLNFAANDLDHMAFSKLFIQTEFLSSRNALIAKRRKRSLHDKENWAVHVVVTDGDVISNVEFETDRAKFIGRGRTLKNPISLFTRQGFSNTAGVSLDPILSLRLNMRVPPGKKIHVAFTTGMASTYDQALGYADRYHDIHSFERESKLAWTKSQVDMRHLNIDSESAFLYQRLAERILYSESSLRPPAYKRAANTNMQSSLWPSGISGDLPIVAVRIRNQKDVSVIRQLLKCHEYLRIKGLVYDFVIINEHPTTYSHDFQDSLHQQIRISGSAAWLNKMGGIFILRSDITPERDISHIQSVARVSLTADEPLKDQINRKAIPEKYPESLHVPILIQKQKEKTANHALELIPDLLFFNGLGGFNKKDHEYVIVLRPGQWTPAPWINVIGNAKGFGFQISEIGSGYTWSMNSRNNRLTPWSNDPVCDPSGEIIYLRDDDTGEVWTATPLPIRTEQIYVVKHGQGYSTFEHISHGLRHKLTVFVPENDTVKISYLTIENVTDRKRNITISSYTEWVLGSQREKTSPYLVCDVDEVTKAIFARNPHDNEFASKISFSDINYSDRTFTCSRKEFLGRHGNYTDPAALKREGLSQKRGTGQDPCAVLQTSIGMEPGKIQEICVLLGQSETVEEARTITLKYRNLTTVKKSLNEVKNFWNTLKNTIQVHTPDESLNLLMNQWLLYQTLSSRFWSRTAFYQSGGAYGFRDQLQDSMALVYSAPHLTREHIIRSCKRQFIEGDVQHWWHPPTGRGVRTRISDDLLWLPFVVSFYVNVTGDKTILTENVSFLRADLLRPEQEDSYTLPEPSEENASVLEHCLRAINHSLPLGEHGLPFIGTGDWNDGMNRVGHLGKGESVWMGWFLHQVISDFLPFCDQPEQSETREKYRLHMEKLRDGLEKNGWDGEWYRRAYFDNGDSLGSSTNTECKIDSVSQSWSVLSGAADPARAKQAMDKVSEFLIQKQSQLILLLTPPFDQSKNDPGYIQGYVPGVRENGGQYTHAAIWVMMAFAKLGDGNETFELFKMLNPILRTTDPVKVATYKIEPYVIAADVYAGGSHEGRGGWSWYTGSASWYYRACLEYILGFRLHGNKLTLSPCLPDHWDSFDIAYRFGSSNYEIKVKNRKGLRSTRVEFEMDGMSYGSELDSYRRRQKSHRHRYHERLVNLGCTLLIVTD